MWSTYHVCIYFFRVPARDSPVGWLTCKRCPRVSVKEEHGLRTTYACSCFHTPVCRQNTCVYAGSRVPMQGVAWVSLSGCLFVFVRGLVQIAGVMPTRKDGSNEKTFVAYNPQSIFCMDTRLASKARTHSLTYATKVNFTCGGTSTNKEMQRLLPAFFVSLCFFRKNRSDLSSLRNRAG